jgi:hypothetical protein
MTPEEALQLIKQGEGQRVEFKSSFAEENKAIESLCAFTHADGGTVFFGVSPDGRVVGTSLGENTLENFSNKLSANTQPPLAPTIYTFTLDGKNVIAVTIPSAGQGQLFYAFNVPYIRVGKTNQVMSPSQQQARLQSPESTIVLGEPVEYPNEYADRTHLVPDPQYASSGTMRPPLIPTQERVTYRLYRVPITSEGCDATNIYVQMAESAPPLQRGLANPILHLAGDRSFIESRGFSLLRGIPREIDVIAVTKSGPYRCFIFSIASDDAMEEHDELDGQYIFRLAAFGGATRDYRVEVDLRQGTLSMTPVVSTKSKVGEVFWLDPGAPTFRVNPGVDRATAETVQLLMTFGQISGDEVTPVIEWSGANVEPSRPLMMPQNQPPGARFQKYQLKPVLARPVPPNDEVSFDIRFRWGGATRQYRWAWPLYVREKGIWGMNNVAGNTLEPKERITLD